MSNSSSEDLSSSLGQLTREQRERLTDVLDQYLSALEKDAPLSQKSLLEANADIAPALANYFRSLEDLHDMAAGFGGGPSQKDEPEDDEKDGRAQQQKVVARFGGEDAPNRDDRSRGFRLGRVRLLLSARCLRTCAGLTRHPPHLLRSPARPMQIVCRDPRSR